MGISGSLLIFAFSVCKMKNHERKKINKDFFPLLHVFSQSSVAIQWVFFRLLKTRSLLHQSSRHFCVLAFVSLFQMESQLHTITSRQFGLAFAVVIILVVIILLFIACIRYICCQEKKRSSGKPISYEKKLSKLKET